MATAAELLPTPEGEQTIRPSPRLPMTAPDHQETGRAPVDRPRLGRSGDRATQQPEPQNREHRAWLRAGPLLTADSIEPDLHLSLRLEAPALCTFELAHFAELLDPGPQGQYFLRRSYTDPLVRGGKWGEHGSPEIVYLRLLAYAMQQHPEAKEELRKLVP